MESDLKTPLVSVLMTVYNEDRYLTSALDSIIRQTFTDFELIVVNDGSTDGTTAILDRYQSEDTRLKVITQKNQGVSIACNSGLKEVRGKYIARHDADDLSDLERLKKQVGFMENNPEVGLLGSNYHIINESGEIVDTTSVFTKIDDLKLAEIFSNQFGQGSIMMRRSVLDKVGLYDPTYRIAHDYDLWLRFSQHTKMANIKEPLYSWRSAGLGLSTSPANIKHMEDEATEIRNHGFDYYLSHKKDYHLLRLNFMSVRKGAVSYLRMNNTLFRNMALLYAEKGLRRKSVPILLLAVLYYPFNKKTYRQLYCTIFQKMALSSFTYEYI